MNDPSSGAGVFESEMIPAPAREVAARQITARTRVRTKGAREPLQELATGVRLSESGGDLRGANGYRSRELTTNRFRNENAGATFHVTIRQQSLATI